MGDPIQYQLVKEKRNLLHGPVLEVGSKFYDENVSFDYRPLFAGEDFTGTDMETGKNVDVVCDLTEDFDKVDRTLSGKRFKTIICASVFEHCANPFKMAENLTQLLEPGGIIFISVPFAFQIHGYPDDYFRYTPRGVEVIFPKLNFSKIPGVFASNSHLAEEIHPLSELKDYWLDFRTAKHRRERSYFKMFSAAVLKTLGRAGLFHWVTKHGYAFPVIQINMFGVKEH